LDYFRTGRNKMAVSNVKAEFECEAEKIWNIVTSLKEYSWRSDLEKIVISEPEKQFEEHTKDGYVTKFIITAYEPYKRYEFDMENDNMKGHWTGLFTYVNGKTTIDFTENVTAKKVFMKPFVGIYLRKQQEAFVRDLRRAVEEK